jgi:hypothetical protein
VLLNRHPSTSTTSISFTRHLLFALHSSWVIKAKKDPRYYFSRKVTLDTTLALTSNLLDDDVSPQAPHHMSKLISCFHFSGNSSSSSVLPSRAGLALNLVHALELIWQLEQEAPTAKSSAQAKLLRAPLFESLKRFAEFQLLRINADEVNVKGLFFTSAVVAQIEAMEKGESDEGVTNAIEEALVRSLRECLEILRAKVPPVFGQDGPQEVNGELNGAAAGGEYDLLQEMEDVDENNI